MAAGISIGVAADTRQFSSNVKKGIQEPLEDVSDVLEDVTKAGDKAGDTLEKSMKGAQKETDDLKKDFKSLGDVIDKETKSAGRNLGKNVKDGTDEGREGLKDFKDEAASTARESAASFDGSAESIGDSFQEIAANALGGFGPAGAVAGLAVAAGMGIGFANIEERAAAMEEFTSDLFEDMIESGQDYASAEFINSRISDILKENINDKGKANDLTEESKRLNLEVSDLIRAQAGDQLALNDVIAAEEAKHDANIAKINESTQSAKQKQAAVLEENHEHDVTLGKYTAIQGGIAATIQAQDLYNASAQTGADKVQRMNDILAGINDKTVTLNADTGPVEQAIRDITAKKVTVLVDLQGRKSGEWVD